jgi:hypothetical protein
MCVEPIKITLDSSNELAASLSPLIRFSGSISRATRESSEDFANLNFKL